MFLLKSRRFPKTISQVCYLSSNQLDKNRKAYYTTNSKIEH